MVCNVKLDQNIQLSLCVRPRSFNIVLHEYVNEHDVSSEQLRPVRWWKKQLISLNNLISQASNRATKIIAQFFFLSTNIHRYAAHNAGLAYQLQVTG